MISIIYNYIVVCSVFVLSGDCGLSEEQSKTLLKLLLDLLVVIRTTDGLSVPDGGTKFRSWVALNRFGSEKILPTAEKMSNVQKFTWEHSSPSQNAFSSL